MRIQLGENNIITKDGLRYLDAILKTALPAPSEPVDIQAVQWSAEPPLIRGTVTDPTTGTPFEVRITCRQPEHEPDVLIPQTLELDDTVVFPLSPLNEAYVLAALEEPEEQPRCQAGNRYASLLDSQMLQVFQTTLELDVEIDDATRKLEESILLWMEKRTASIDMDSAKLLAPRLLRNVKRVYMHGPARNKVMVEYHDGSTQLFREMFQPWRIELCYEILSII